MALKNRMDMKHYMKLYGDYHCRITVVEANDWRRMFRANFQAEEDKLLAWENSLKLKVLAGAKIDAEDTLNDIYKGRRNLEDKVLIATEDWFQEVQKKRKEEKEIRAAARRGGLQQSKEGE